MPVDTSIIRGLQPLQLPQQDPNQGMNALARMMQIQGMQQEQGLNALKMQDAQRTSDRRNKLDTLLGGFSGKPEELGPTLLKGGFLDEASKVEKDRRENEKVAAEAKFRAIETAHKTVDLVGQTMGWVRQNPTLENATAAINHLVTVGGMPQDQAQQTLAALQANPNGVAQFADMVFRSALQAKDQLPKYETRNTGGTTDTLAIDPVSGQVRVANTVQNTQSPDNKATTGLGYARLGEEKRHNTTMEGYRSNEIGQGKTQIVETPQGFVIVDKNTGQSRPATGADGQPLKGKANDRVMTDAQAKANLFGTRMKESDRILSQLESQGVTNPGLIKGAVQGVAGMTPFMGDKMSDAAGSLMNTLPPVLGGPNSDQQQVEQARRDFLNAVLRRESGAVISPSEFANAERQYFPQPGDSKVVLQQKAANRKLAISGLEAEVPGGFRGQQHAPANATTTISSDAEYAALPSGATFVGPDGKTRRKP